MSVNILMPALSPTMTEGTIAKWLKKEGDMVASGDLLAEIETDKATMELEAVDEGKLARIVVPAGTQGVAVNQVIAVIAQDGEELGAVPVSAPAVAPKVAAAPAAAIAKPAAPPPAAPPPPGAGGARVFASPLARRIAAQAGVAIDSVKGSGPQGRIVKADVEAVASVPAAMRAPASVDGLPPYTEIAHSTMRKTIARRMVESKTQAPHFYLTVDCEIDRLMQVRKELNGRSPEGEGAYKLSINDFVIRAAALALKKVPQANAMWTDTAIRRFSGADISVAVAVPGGLVTPIVRAADVKGLEEISREVMALAVKAKKGALAPEEYCGGTFTISNLGMYGVKEFGAVINPSQGAILAVGAAEPRAVVHESRLTVATVMSCTLSVDHRAVDGVDGARFLAAFKKLIEDPLTMLL